MTEYDIKISPERGSGELSLVLVGRDLGRNEVRKKRPFVGRAGSLLDDALKEAGIQRSQLQAVTNVVMRRPPNNDFDRHQPWAVDEGRDNLERLIEDLDPNCVVALGNEAAYALIPDWPTKGRDIFGAKGIQERRGFIFEGFHGGKVVATVHPSFALRSWVPWRTLLAEDLKRGKEEAQNERFDRPEREVVAVGSEKDCERSLRRLRSSQSLACDIEITDRHTLACVGFASSRSQAHVFPAKFVDRLGDLLRSRSLIWQNGAFDRYFLKTRCGIEPSVDDDTMLAWHACYPELAGTSSEKSYKQSRKGLSFLASMFTRDEWWKDYDFAGDHEMYELNGLDCMITFEIMEKLDDEIDQLDVRDIYEHNLSLVPVVVDMQARGLKVDEEKRQKRIRQLTERFDELDDTVNEIALPIIEDHRDRLEDVWHLFEVGGFETETGRRETCPCCNGGKAKSASCWACAGFDSAPNKSEVVEKYGNPNDLNKDELIDEVIPECQVCGGDGKRTELRVNPRSRAQMRAILYDALKLPKRYTDGSLSVDEDSLKSIRATL